MRIPSLPWKYAETYMDHHQIRLLSCSVDAYMLIPLVLTYLLTYNLFYLHTYNLSNSIHVIYVSLRADLLVICRTSPFLFEYDTLGKQVNN